jgi:hypothetical protein
MTVSFDSLLPSLVILSGATVSNILNAKEHYGDAVGITIQSPGTLDAGTYSIQVSSDGVTFATWQEGATLADVAVPAVNKATMYETLVGFMYIRLAGPTAAADRTFKVSKHWTS